MIVLDSNILLEILENRRYYEATVSVLGTLSDQQLAITTLTVSNVFYIAEKNKLDFSKVEAMIKAYDHLGVIASDVAWALGHYNGKDFEDALQIAAAIREKCSLFMTLDASLTQKYSKKLNIQLIR